MSNKNVIIAMAADLDNVNDLLEDHSITDELAKFIKEAQSYILGQSWCLEVENGWLAEEWEGILSVFLFKIKPLNKNVDEYVWIVVGDIPPAYIDIKSAITSSEVLSAYCYIMKDWVETVLSGESVEDCFPINVAPGEKYAQMLLSRIRFIESNLFND